MKLLPMIATNLLCVGVGIGAYDFIKSGDETNASGDPALMESSDVSDRLAALENRTPNSGPLLAGTEAPRLSEDAIVELIRKHAPVSDGATTASGESVPVKVLDVARIADNPSDDDLAAFRKVLDKVDAVRRAERDATRQKQREERMIKRLTEFNLNESQREDLIKLAKSQREKMTTMWQKVREGGGGRDEMREAFDSMRTDLTKAVEEIAPGEDASKIVRAVSGMGGGMARGGRRGGGGR